MLNIWMLLLSCSMFTLSSNLYPNIILSIVFWITCNFLASFDNFLAFTSSTFDTGLRYNAIPYPNVPQVCSRALNGNPGPFDHFYHSNLDFKFTLSIQKLRPIIQLIACEIEKLVRRCVENEIPSFRLIFYMVKCLEKCKQRPLWFKHYYLRHPFCLFLLFTGKNLVLYAAFIIPQMHRFFVATFFHGKLQYDNCGRTCLKKYCRSWHGSCVCICWGCLAPSWTLWLAHLPTSFPSRQIQSSLGRCRRNSLCLVQARPDLRLLHETRSPQRQVGLAEKAHSKIKSLSWGDSEKIQN